MKITLHGASGGEVTGSAYLIETKTANVLVDFGLFQGAHKIENQNQLPKSEGVRKLHAVVPTHAHLDHTGRLPLLTRMVTPARSTGLIHEPIEAVASSNRVSPHSVGELS